MIGQKNGGGANYARRNVSIVQNAKHVKTVYYQDCVQYCGTLGVDVLNAPRESCAKVRTAFCRAHCYINKLERIYPATFTMRQAKLRAVWNDNNKLYLAITALAKHARMHTGLARFASYGEALAFPFFPAALYAAAVENPDVRFLMFTRYWRTYEFKSGTYRTEGIVRFANMRRALPENVSIICSTDPTTTPAEHAALREAGMRRSFFGDDNNAPDNTFAPCPKTFEHNTNCAQCRMCWEREDFNPHFKEH